jgi:hypothetical protein
METKIGIASSFFIVLSILARGCHASTPALRGVILLDHLSFNKTVGKFPHTIVKFDSIFPNDGKHTVRKK